MNPVFNKPSWHTRVLIWLAWAAWVVGVAVNEFADRDFDTSKIAILAILFMVQDIRERIK